MPLNIKTSLVNRSKTKRCRPPPKEWTPPDRLQVTTEETIPPMEPGMSLMDVVVEAPMNVQNDSGNEEFLHHKGQFYG